MAAAAADSQVLSSLVRRPPASTGAKASTGDELWRQFTPAKVTINNCLARTWGGGLGGQCVRCPAPGQQYCVMHGNDKWKVHGNVKGPIPEKKLLEFQKAAVAASRQQQKASGADPSSSSKAPASAGPKAKAQAAAGPKAKAADPEAVELRVRRSTPGIVTREELEAAAQSGLVKIIQGKGPGWRNPAMQMLCESLQKETLARDALKQIQEKIWQLQESEVADLVQRDLGSKRGAADGEQQGTKRKADGDPAGAPAAGAKPKVAGGAQETRARAQGPSAQGPSTQAEAQDAAKARADKEKEKEKSKTPRCTCGCPIHQIRCPLFKCVYQPQRDVKFVAGVASGRPQTTAGQSATAPHRGPRAPSLSAPAAERVAQIANEVRKLPQTQQRAEWKKKMLLYHPDKRQGQGSGGDDAAVATEVFMEIKRRFDSLPP